MTEVMARGIRFNALTIEPDVPDPPVVVFVHGLVLDNLSSFYYTLAAPISVAGARAVLYDLRGHGRSERTTEGYGVADAVADLFAVLDALGEHRPVYILANSWGGLVALTAALERPARVAGLALVEAQGPSERPGEWHEDLLNTLGRSALLMEHERLADRLGALGWRRNARFAATSDALLNGTTLLDDLAADEPVGPAGLAAVTCPVLAVYGEHSDLLDAGLLLRRAVPDCTLHVLPGIAHTILQEGTSTLLEILLPWLADHAGTTPPATAGTTTPTGGSDPTPALGDARTPVTGGAR